MIATITAPDLPALFAKLREYQKESGKTWTEILPKEGKEWGIAMYDAFKKLSPNRGSITSSARGRGFKVGRSESSWLVPRSGKLSARSYEAADTLLGGEKSDYFKVEDSGGVTRIKPVRFSARTGKRLSGGRSGRKFAASAVRGRHAKDFWDDVSGDIESQLKDPSIVQLNRQAVATTIELARRESAAGGGTLAFQWLPSVYRKRSSSVVKRGELVNNTRRGQRIGSIKMVPGTNGEILSVILEARAPGTQEQMDKHGIFGRVAALRIADRQRGIELYQQRAAEKAGLK